MTGKRKGSSAEREIARFLTKWLTGQDKELYFWRSPGSGAVATINIGNHDIAGDIVPVKPEALLFCSIFFIEVKDGYSNTDIFQHLKGNKTFTLANFWRKATSEAKASNKFPLLFFRKKNGKWTIGIDSYIKHKLDMRSIAGIALYLDGETNNIYMYNRDDFFNILTQEKLQRLSEDIMLSYMS